MFRVTTLLFIANGFVRVANSAKPPHAVQQSFLNTAAAAAPSPAAAGAPGAAKGTPALAGKMPLKAAEQGFEGEHVKHVDQETHTADWGKEYGPHGPQPIHEEPPKRSGSCRVSVGLLGTTFFALGAISHGL